MIIIDSPFHITFSYLCEIPKYACESKCKKCFWLEDMEDRNKETCPQCGGVLTQAVESVHFKILMRANRDLKFSDFRKIRKISYKEKMEIKDIMGSEIKVTHLSLVKGKFIEKAKDEWC